MKIKLALFLLGLLSATQVNAGCLSPEDNYGSPTPCGGNPAAGVGGNPYYTPLDVHRNIDSENAVRTKVESKVDEKKEEQASPEPSTHRLDQRVNQQLDPRR